MSIYSIRAYYKGTSIEHESIDLLTKVKANAHNMIVKGLKTGLFLEFIKQDLKSQLDALENGLKVVQVRENSVGKFGNQNEWLRKGALEVGMKDREGQPMTGAMAASLWFLNVAALIELGVIDDDEMNGWTVIQSRNDDILNIHMNDPEDKGPHRVDIWVRRGDGFAKL